MGSNIFVIGGFNKTLIDTEVLQNTGSLINPNYESVFFRDSLSRYSDIIIDFGEIIRVEASFTECQNLEQIIKI